MKIKICGMKNPDNIQAVADLYPDYLGFIFYEKSKRYVLDTNRKDFADFMLSATVPTQKVAVFVNEDIKSLIRTASEFDITTIQLHGEESPEYCEHLRLLGFTIIKAFGIHASFDFSILNEYADVCDYYLFDTASKEYGGTGLHFDWNLLKQYDNSKPVFISGGLDVDDIATVYDLLKDIRIQALDFNSKLEVQPGLKALDKCKKAIELVRTLNT